MTTIVLSLVILVQIALYQIVAALAIRSVMLKEMRLLVSPAPDGVASYIRRAPVQRIILGVILACCTLLPVIGIVSNPTAVAWLLVCSSLVSALAFSHANARDRTMMRRLADCAPGGSVRRASLEPRSLRQWYHPALEAIPVAIFVATLLFLVGVSGFVGADESGFAGERARILVIFGLQGVIVFGALWYALRKGVDLMSMASYIPSLRRRPEVAHRLGAELAGTQARYFMFARIGIAALLGAGIVERVFKALGNPGAALWDVGGWVILAVLLISFFIYLGKVGRVSRKMQTEMETTARQEGVHMG